MSKKIDARLPKEVGTGLYPVKSPWDKMISYHDAAHYCQRYTKVVSAAVMQAFRDVGYDDWATGEMIPAYAQASDQIIFNTAASMGRILGGAL